MCMVALWDGVLKLASSTLPPWAYQNQEIDSVSMPSLLLWSFTLGGKVLGKQTLPCANLPCLDVQCMCTCISLDSAVSIVLLHTGVGCNVFQACALHWHLIDRLQEYAAQC